MFLIIGIQLLNGNTFMPCKGTSGSAGFDCFCPNDYLLSPNSVNKISLDFKLDIPPGYYVEIHDKSSIVFFSEIHVLGGIIDCDYKGCIYVILQNISVKNPVCVSEGEAICQMIVKKYEENVQLIKVHDVGMSNRGDGGFGSTKYRLTKELDIIKEFEERSSEEDDLWLKAVNEKYEENIDCDLDETCSLLCNEK